MTYIKVQRLRCARHIQRAPKDYPPKQILHCKIEGGRQPGRPKWRWLDGIDRDTNAIGVGHWRSVAIDKIVWRRKLEQALGGARGTISPVMNGGKL